MPEQTRQRICQCMFLLTCVLPLVATVAWAGWQHVSTRSRCYQDWFAGQLGIELRVGNVQRIRPATTRLQSLNLVDPETTLPIARCPLAEVHQAAGSVLLVARHVLVEPGEFPRLLDLLHDRVLRQARLVQSPLSLVVEQLTIKDSPRDLKLQDVRLGLNRELSGPVAHLQFRWSHTPDADLVHLYVQRALAGNAPVTRIQLLTGTTPLPCRVFRRLPVPATASQPDVTYCGHLDLTMDANGWSGEMTGTVQHLPYAWLGGALAADTDEGSGTLQLRRAVLRQNRLTELEGQLMGGPGQAYPWRLASMADHLHLQSATQLAHSAAGTAIPFRQLAIRFRVSAAGELFLLGSCDEPDSGVLLAGEARPLVWQSEPTTATTVTTSDLLRAYLDLPPTQTPVSLPRHSPLHWLPTAIEGGSTSRPAANNPTG